MYSVRFLGEVDLNAESSNSFGRRKLQGMQHKNCFLKNRKPWSSDLPKAPRCWGHFLKTLPVQSAANLPAEDICDLSLAKAHEHSHSASDPLLTTGSAFYLGSFQFLRSTFDFLLLDWTLSSTPPHLVGPWPLKPFPRGCVLLTARTCFFLGASDSWMFTDWEHHCPSILWPQVLSTTWVWLYSPPTGPWLGCLLCVSRNSNLLGLLGTSPTTPTTGAKQARCQSPSPPTG